MNDTFSARMSLSLRYDAEIGLRFDQIGDDMTLRDQGFRFIKRGNEFKWQHPGDLRANDIDCTDMSDDDFAAFVAAHTAPGAA